MNTFLMFVGVPGNGKSTVIAEQQLKITNKYGVDGVLSSDAIIEDIAAQVGLTYTEVFKDAIPHAGKFVESMMGILSLAQRSFILDQTNLTAKTRQRKLGLLIHPNNYYKVAVVFDQVPKAELLSRLTKRNESGKIISEELLDNMLKSYQPPTLQEGFNKIMTAQEFLDSLPESSQQEEIPKFGEMKFH